MAEKTQAKLLEYKGRPLIRKDNILYYGNISEENIVMLNILGTEPFEDITLAKRVSISLMLTDQSLNPMEQIVKSSEKPDLFQALDLAAVWLDRAEKR